MAMFILRSLKNPKSYIQIGATPVRIGRSSDNALTLREKSVSRVHATIQLESGGLVLTDLNSTRGTFVNGVQVKRRRIKPGDVISFGKVQWKVEESSAGHSVPRSSGLFLSSVSNPEQQFPLTKGQINIGRSQKNQLRIPNKSISREHAVIQYEKGKFKLVDKTSALGTFVNNKRVKQAVIKPGDVIAFGDEQWRVMPAEEIQPADSVRQPDRQVRIGQIRMGGYNLNLNPVYGGALQPGTQGQTPQLQSTRTPVFIRPCHFGQLVNRTTEIKTAAASGPRSPVQFYGPPGIGKSTLLCYLSHHPFADTFTDGVVHLLARGRGMIDLLQDIFAAFYSQPAGFVATEVEIRNYLQSKNALILLDDVELNPKETSELMSAAPRCAFIIASSKKCLPRGGRLMELSDFKAKESLELFGKVIGRALNSEEQSFVKMICAALRNNPVRVVQAASYVRDAQQSIGGVASILNVASPLEVFNNLIAQSLSEVEGFVLSILAALGGSSIHNRHLPALVGTKNTKQVLNGLIRRGLVKEMGGRYSLTGTFVDYLQQAWDLSEWGIRLLDHFATWVERHQEEPEYVLFETEAILGILTWAARVGKWQKVLRLCRSVESLMMVGKQWSSWEKVLGWSLQAAQALGDQAAEAWALHQLGTRAMCLGDTATANASLEKAYQLRQSIGDQVGADLARQNQSLLSISPPAPPRPSVPKLAQKLLRPLFLAGGAAAVVTTAVVVALSLWPRPEPPVPVPEADTATATESVLIIETDTMTPSRAPTETRIPTGTRTVTPTGTRTITPTYTSTVTRTPSSTYPPADIGTPQLSSNQVYYGGTSCGTDKLTIRVTATHPAGIKYVFFFHKLREVDGSKESDWADGLAMSAAGGGTYSLSVRGDTLVEGTGFSTSAQVSYQIIIQPQNGDYVRSDFYKDLILLPCEISTEPPPTTPPPLRPPAPLIIYPQRGEILSCPFGTVYLRWSEPYDINGIQSYQIKLIEEVKPGLGTYVINPLTVYDTQYNVSSIISCGKKYDWTVRALNNNGVWSEFSSSQFSVSYKYIE